MVASAPQKQFSKQSLPSNKQGKSWLARVAPFVVWQIIAILCAELLLFSAGLGEEEILQLDPDLGTKHMTNKRVTWRVEGYAQSYLNGDGLRESGVTLAKPLNTYRIALLGDSMVEGLQVPVEASFGQILARQLSLPGKVKPPPLRVSSHELKVQVLNFGTSGYSTAQEYLQLKKQVLKYQPNLVVLCYNSRDIFENWSPADEVITNVRPVALHLPGGKLVVHSYYVKRWLKSPRAKFLHATQWLKQNSRIWGLLSAMDLDLSLHNSIYRTLILFLTQPKKAVRQLATAVTSVNSLVPTFQIKTFEDTGSQSKQPSFNSATSNKVLKMSPVPQETNHQLDGRKIYLGLIKRTMSSLIAEMRQECNHAGAKFVLATLPVRASLCPAPGMETEFYNIDYAHEIKLLTDICQQQDIPIMNCQQLAEQLPLNQRSALFYSVHLTPDGHKFLSHALNGFLQQQMAQSYQQGKPQPPL
ncbi:MAG: hypothetical protein HY711_11115 [Candidatus Melainabacteria bacterium]|nr:hypothetical protein [Candidatus Melainabacteria bacterium]